MNEQVKERIISTALPLFLCNGVKSVTMDDIASKVGISKRTLYELFEDKNQLLLSCLAYKKAKSKAEIEAIISQCNNSLEIFLKVSRYRIEDHRFINPLFFSDIKRFYPSIVEENQTRDQEGKKQIQMLLEQGIAEGVFRPEIQIGIVYILWKAQIEYISQFYLELLQEYPFDLIFRLLIDGFVRSIASAKGLALIEAIQQEEQKVNIDI